MTMAYAERYVCTAYANRLFHKVDTECLYVILTGVAGMTTDKHSTPRQ